MTIKRQKVNILGVNVDDLSQKEAVAAIFSMAGDKKGHHQVVTVNSEFVMLARKDSNFREILNNADLAVADGVGVVFSKLILGGKVHDRITGVDLIEKLCEKSEDWSVTIGFLGGFGNVADSVKKRQLTKFPRLRIKIAEPGDPAIGYDLRLKKQLVAVGRVDILFVAYGMGQQELWIKRNKNKLNVGVFIGVGGAFNLLSGVKRRAPSFMQKTGLEWLWRLVLEPRRIRRMMVLPVYLVLVIGQFFQGKKISHNNNDF